MLIHDCIKRELWEISSCDGHFQVALALLYLSLSLLPGMQNVHEAFEPN